MLNLNTLQAKPSSRYLSILPIALSILIFNSSTGHCSIGQLSSTSPIQSELILLNFFLCICLLTVHSYFSHFGLFFVFGSLCHQFSVYYSLLLLPVPHWRVSSAESLPINSSSHLEILRYITHLSMVSLLFYKVIIINLINFWGL